VENYEQKIIQTLSERDDLTPRTIFDYYQNLETNLEQKKYFHPIIVAKNLPSETKYHKDQFNLLKINEERKAEVDFLCILKLCHLYLKIPTTLDKIKLLQREIFQTDLYDPERMLDTWIQISGRYCVISDVKLDAIEINQERKIMILDYLSRNLWDVIPDDMNTVEAAGIFLGSSLGSGGLSLDMLYNFALELVSKNNDYAYRLGKSIAEWGKLSDLEKDIQESIIHLATESIPFAVGLGQSLGERISSLEGELRNRVLDLEKENRIFANSLSLGEGLSWNSYFTWGNRLAQDKEQDLFNFAKEDKYYAAGLGSAFGNWLKRALSDIQQSRTLEFASQNNPFAIGLGLAFNMHKRELTDEEWQKINKNNQCFREAIRYEEKQEDELSESYGLIILNMLKKYSC
jgi:hypothetical protein